MGVIYTYCFNTKLTKTMLRNIITRGHVKEEFWLIILGYSKLLCGGSSSEAAIVGY